MSPDLDALLCQKYPRIFAQRDLPMSQTAMSWGISCGDGWFTLLDVLCEELQRQTDVLEAPQVETVQIKEKFGGLRVYVTVSNDVQAALIMMAETLSTRTCEECGAPGTLSNFGGWRVTRCMPHSQPQADREENP